MAGMAMGKSRMNQGLVFFISAGCPVSIFYILLVAPLAER